MLLQRLQVILILIPGFVFLAALGDWYFAVFIAISLGIAAWEFNQIFKKGKYSPWKLALICGASLFSLRSYMGLLGSELLFVLILLASMTFFVIQYEQGNKNAAVDFCVTLAGIFYIGGLGGYLISLRNMPDGLWWLLLAIPAAWFTDMGGYLVGRRFGKHKMSPKLSPKKTWEGYVGGILLGIVGTALLAQLWHLRAPSILWFQGLIMGLVISVITPLGDLGESMFKRQFGVKDSSNLLPGHGGVLDRIDTWLWSSAIGYYLVTFLFLNI